MMEEINSHVKPIDILLVEDNPGDVRLTREALLETKVLTNLYTVENGVDALDFLYKRKAFSNGEFKPGFHSFGINFL